MWSFAILDKESQIVFLSRDRFGIKPLYYFVNATKFIFGSEIKQLLEYTERKPNINRVYDYIILSRDEHGEETFFSDIFKVPASSNLIYDLKKNSFKLNSYYTIERLVENKTQSLDEACIGFSKILNDSIKLRLRSDVEVGSCLSGGLDSSAIVTFASNIMKSKQNKFQTFHANFIENKNKDESKFVNILSNNLTLKSNIIKVDRHHIKNLCNESIKIQEEPFLSPSVILQLIIMREAKKNNCKVLLDGQGGDEILLGYERYFSKIIFSAKWYQKLPLLMKFSKNSKLSILDIIKYYFYFNYNYLRTYLTFKRTSFIIKSNKFKDWKRESRPFFKNLKSISDFQKQEIIEDQLPHLLRYEDKNSMNYSVEARLPFLDYRIVEYSLSIPSVFKTYNGWSKYILRRSIDKRVPKEISWRKNKLGFEIDEKKLLNSLESDFYAMLPNSGLSKSLFNHKYLKNNYSKLPNRLKWRLYNLLKWEKIFNLKT